MDPDTRQEARPLAVLRAMIDTVDHDILHLLSRRAALVGEVAAYKRTHAVQIRDLDREREILQTRSATGTGLGLSPAVVDSIYRLILWESRDRQAALRAEVPPETEPQTVAVIGGMGQMGQCMVRMFRDLGHHVIVSDRNTDTPPEQAAASADVVVISVPIAGTVEVIEQLGPLVRPEALLMDVTSVKRAPVDAMLRASCASVVGTHPMFAPSVHSLQGQRVVLCPGRGREWEEWVRRMFHARGLVVTEADPAHHDRVMAVVQVLVHYRTEVMGKALADLGVSIEETLKFTSPIYLLDLMMTARHFGQSADLYAAIGMSNPAADEVTAAFAAAAADVRDLIVKSDQKGFHQLFKDVRSYFGDFTDEAMDQSSYLIDRLVERS